MCISIHFDSSRKGRANSQGGQCRYSHRLSMLKSLYVKSYNCTCLSFVRVTAKSIQVKFFKLCVFKTQLALQPLHDV